MRTGPLGRAHHPVDPAGGPGSGFRRAPDDGQRRAFLGPLVALAVLAGSGEAYDQVFVTSFCIAALAVAVLVLFVREPGPAVGTEAAPTARVTVREAWSLLRLPPVRRLLVTSCLLGLATIGDGFVYLLLQRREELSLVWFPLLAVGTSLIYLLLATPLGILADRIGRRTVMLGGYGLLLVTYLVLFGPVGGWPLLVVVLGLYGAFYAATNGVLMALAGPVLPEPLRATGIALIQTGQALSYVASSAVFGLAWMGWGPETASRLFAIVVGLMGLAAFRLVREV